MNSVVTLSTWHNTAYCSYCTLHIYLAMDYQLVHVWPVTHPFAKAMVNWRLPHECLASVRAVTRATTIFVSVISFWKRESKTLSQKENYLLEIVSIFASFFLLLMESLSVIQFQLKLIKIWDPRHAGFYKQMYVRRGSVSCLDTLKVFLWCRCTLLYFQKVDCRVCNLCSLADYRSICIAHMQYPSDAREIFELFYVK